MCLSGPHGPRTIETTGPASIRPLLSKPLSHQSKMRQLNMGNPGAESFQYSQARNHLRLKASSTFLPRPSQSVQPLIMPFCFAVALYPVGPAKRLLPPSRSSLEYGLPILSLTQPRHQSCHPHPHLRTTIQYVEHNVATIAVIPAKAANAIVHSECDSQCFSTCHLAI